MSDKRKCVVYYNVLNRNIYDAAGNRMYNDYLPYICTNEEIDVEIHLVTNVKKTGVEWAEYTGLADVSGELSGSIENNWTWWLNGTVTATEGLDGTVAEITGVYSGDGYVNPDGILKLKNSSGECELVEYSAVARGDDGALTFSVDDAELLYVYADGDELEISEVPILSAKAVDMSGLDTGILQLTFSAVSEKYYHLIEGNEKLTDTYLEVQLSTSGTDPKLVFRMTFAIVCLNIYNNTNAVASEVTDGRIVRSNPDLEVLNAPETLPTSFDAANTTVQEMAEIIATLMNQLKGN